MEPTTILENLLTYCELRLEYKVYGSGNVALLAFHGFGQSAEDFKVFEQYWGQQFRIYSFNLFHHGGSTYPAHRIEKNTLKKEELRALFKQFFVQEQIEQVALAGYSMGGKIVLTLMEYFPKYIQQVYLFAPDGITINRWYRFTSNTKLGPKLFKYIIAPPKRFHRILNTLRGLRLITEKRKKFILFHMGTPEKRQLVFDVWMTFRNIEPNISLVQQKANEHNIEMQLFFGKYDRVIPPHIGSKFIEALDTPHQLHVMEAGHDLITLATCKYMEAQEI